MPDSGGLIREDLGHLNYLRRVLAQPIDRWDGFYQPRSESMNFALRFQLAFAAYAVAALALRTPAYRAPYAEALGAAVERMLDARAWGYWRVPPNEEGGRQATGHVALILSPHRRAGAATLPPPADPVAQDNVQYSGHLGTMLGLYERVSGDGRYDGEFTLEDPESGAAYSYTHTRVAARIYEQMRANYFHGVACEPSCAYVPCNNHAMSSNTIHDAIHGTDFGAANKDWIAWVRRKMVLRGSAVRGLFGACFLRDVGLSAPVAFQFTDSWGLAFLQPFDPQLARKLYRVFRRRVSRDGDGAYVGSAPICERMEISDVPLNTGFGLIAARGLGDEKIASALQRYADEHFAPVWNGVERYYAGAPRTLHTTALLALGRVAGEGTMRRLFHQSPHRDHDAPELIGIEAAGGSHTPSHGVARAEYSLDKKKLDVELLYIGDDESGREPIALAFGNVRHPRRVCVDGMEWTGWQHSEGEGVVKLALPGTARCVEVFV